MGREQDEKKLIQPSNDGMEVGQRNKQELGKLHTVAHAFLLHFSFHHWGTQENGIGKKGA